LAPEVFAAVQRTQEIVMMGISPPDDGRSDMADADGVEIVGNGSTGGGQASVHDLLVSRFGC